ncbi:cysteine proteinase [Hesseltinella vesiculosa]|uniref:Cysteine proteinase n=1 Tax=Hesseltinella vesiculosa TaxID=101127 RepID=A0A1X2G4I1_9FUNG|nr:cysteine proteinase [Hesseltinella vesiculosa]
MSRSTACLAQDSCAALLLHPAFALARQAVQLDQQGQYLQAVNDYHQLIQMFDVILKSPCSMADGHLDREQLVQKKNEYIQRAMQLDRLALANPSHPDGCHATLRTTDCQHQALARQCPEEVATSISVDDQPHEPDNDDLWGESDFDEDDEDDETKDIKLSIAKGKFSMGQGEVYVFMSQVEENDTKLYLDHALKYYEDAATWYLKAFGLLHESHPLKIKVRQQFLIAMEAGESAKAQQKTPTSFSKIPSTDPEKKKPLTKEELEVIRVTSYVNNKRYYPWMDQDLHEFYSCPTRFLDKDGSLQLSANQSNKFGGWVRPSDIMKHPKMIRLISSTSIIQDIVTDCSFVASLCVAAAYERKFKKQLITTCIYPQDKHGKPCYNPSGKYLIKLFFNGIARKIEVDDLLPMSREGTLMCTFSNNKEELWPSLVEKAYMKLMGGYDFPGSNSGIDLYCLTGWIPDHIFIHEQRFDPDNVWARMLDGAKYGDALVTIATGHMTDEEADKLGLVPTHAYAIIDIKEAMGTRFLQVKNPWSHMRWCGPFSHMDRERWTPELKAALNYDPQLAQDHDDGIFWIDYESMCANFTSIHMNWNPELFIHRDVVHAVWPEARGPDNILNLGYNPQFSLTVEVHDKKPAAVWILLSKHIMVTEENTDYITLHIYKDTNGDRIYYPDDTFKKGTYVNSPHILLRFTAPPGTSTYTIVVSQHEKIHSLYFTLRLFSFAPFQLAETPNRFTVEQKIHSQWTDRTAGGNVCHASFLNNPQWKVTIPKLTQPVPLLLMLEAPKTFAVNLFLVESGKRVASVSSHGMLMGSGSYRHGFCYYEKDAIPAGEYTLVASTFEAELVGEFDLTVASNISLDVEPIPSEGAGMFPKVLTGEWIAGWSAMGNPDYKNYGKNPRYTLEVRELTTVRVRLQADKIDPIPSINVAIYEKHPTHAWGQEIATSGPYTNAIQGVTTGDIVLNQNEAGYIIVFATHDKDITGDFTAYIYSDRPIKVKKDR